MAQATLPDGALCAEHPEVPAEMLCVRCGSFACNACTRSEPPRSLCAQCVEAPAVLADPGQRLVAHVIDLIALLGPLLVAGAAGLWPARAGHAQAVFALGCVTALVTTGFSLFGIHREGQSLGKRALGLQVLQSDGARASLAQVVWLRNVLPALLHLIPLFGVLFAIADPLMLLGARRQSLHDRLADTIVVKKRDVPLA